MSWSGTTRRSGAPCWIMSSRTPGRQDLILVFAYLILGPSTSGGVFTPDALSSMPGQGIGWAHGRPRRNRVGGEQGFAGTQSSAVPLSLGQIEDCMFPIHGERGDPMPPPIAYLVFDGTCAEAMRFYERALEAKLEVLMTNGESPIAEHRAPGTADRILHARLALPGGGVLMAGDSTGGAAYEGIKGVPLALNYDSVREAESAFAALSEEGKVTMPLQATSWSKTWGMLVDRFGTPWMVNGELLARALPDSLPYRCAPHRPAGRFSRRVGYRQIAGPAGVTFPCGVTRQAQPAAGV